MIRSPWMDDDDGRKLAEFEASCIRDGYAPIPDHVPIPLGGYEYRTFGPLIRSRPRIRLRDRILFRLPRWLAGPLQNRRLPQRGNPTPTLTK